MRKHPLTIIAFTALLTMTSSYASIFHSGQKNNNKAVAKPAAKTIKTSSIHKLKVNINTQVKRLQGKTQSLDPKVLRLALTAYDHAATKGIVKKPYLTIIDYSKPSYEKRMWIVNLAKDSVLYHTYVAHGQGSGVTKPTRFSNVPQSKESSLGTFLTGNSYFGHKGIAMRLNGLEQGINNKALSRAIVMHGAWYMNPSFIQKYHRAGRSWGCPAVGTHLAKPIINTIKDGSVIFAYYPKQQFLKDSRYV